MTKLVVVSLAAVSFAAGGLHALSDEFDGTALTGWQTMLGDDFGSGTAHQVSVADGALTLTPVRSWWVDNHEALFVWKPVRGDFVATIHVRVTGTKTDGPQANWSLSGLLVRDPRSTHANENWVSFRTGVVDNSRVYERKSTLHSHSILSLGSSPEGWVDLRIGRVGTRFFLLKRNAAGRFIEHWSYNRPDLPATVQVGIDAFSGYADDHADLTSRVDWFRVAPTGVPKRLRNARDAKIVPYLARTA
jgi:hypothetical protein